MQNIHLDEFSSLSNDLVLFNLIHAYRLVEKFIDSMDTFVYFRPVAAGDDIKFALQASDGSLLYPTRFDVCECPNLLKCPNGTHSTTLGAKILSDCIPTQDDVLSRLPLQPMIYNENSNVYLSTNLDEISTEMLNFESLKLEAYDIAILKVNLEVLPRNMTYGRDYRLSIYKNCKPCPAKYRCVGETRCSYPSEMQQYSILNDCLKNFRVNICVHKNRTSMPLEICQENNGHNDTILYSEPNLEKCLSSTSFFCKEKMWEMLKFRKLCQNDDNAELFPCSDIDIWNDYLKIRELNCCSTKHKQSLVGICSKESCSLDVQEEQNFLSSLDPQFQRVKKYLSTGRGPRGSLVMDKDLQEDIDNNDILALFEGSYHLSDGKVKTKMPWIRSKSCCQCKPEPLPAYFRMNKETSGYPDNKHLNITFTISALEKTNLTAVIELLNGQYHSFFHTFSKRKGIFSYEIHRPNRFSNLKKGSLWLSIVKRETLASAYVNNPLNLPHRRDASKTVDLETSLLIDRPCKQMFQQTGNNGQYDAYDDDGKLHPEDTCVPDDYSFVHTTESWWTIGTRMISAVALPYFPYFSSCDEFDSHISLSRIIEEHPNCTKVPYNQTTYIKHLALSDAKFPQADHCLHHYPPVRYSDGIIKGGAALHCHFEEKIELPSDRDRWYEVEAKSILFYMTKDAIPSNYFNLEYQSSGERSGWDGVLLEKENIIPVVVSELHGGVKNTIPREVTLELQYFQLDKYNKRLVSATIHFTELCTILKPEHLGGDPEKLKEMRALNITPCEVDIHGSIKSHDYMLRIALYPLEWFSLLNRFQFHWLVYLTYFTFAGFVSASVSCMLWGFNRITTKLRYPPKFHGLSLLKVIITPSLHGTTMALSTLISCCFLSLAVIHVRPSFWDQIIGDWSITFSPDKAMLITVENGRMGMILLIVGIYLTSLSASHIILQKESPQNDVGDREDFFADIEENHKNACCNAQLYTAWKRIHFLLFCFAVEFCLLSLWEFSYSQYFETFLYEIVVVSKILLWILEIISTSILDEKLLVVPFLIAFEVSLTVLTIGASDFMDFTGVFFTQMSMTILHRTYVHPFMKSAESLSARWRFVLTQKLSPTLNMKAQDRLLQAKKWKQINETIELRNEGSEPIIDAITLYSVNTMTCLLSPFPFMLISSYYYQSQMAAKYNIDQTELAYYALFACCMIPWSFVIDVMIFNTQEIVHGWKMYEYLEFQREKFLSRRCKWSLNNHNISEDRSVAKHLWTIDLMSFSSQYYFATSVLAGSIIITLFGGTILMRTEEYNFLSDPALPILLVCVLSIVTLLKYFAFFVFSFKIGYLDWEGVWGNFEVEGSIDDGLLVPSSSKDSVNHFRTDHDKTEQQDDIEAMNDEGFRQRFLERNRPWILKALMDILVSSEKENNLSYMEKMKLLEYTKGAYSELTNSKNPEQKKERRKGTLNGASSSRSSTKNSDNDEEDKELRRSWNFEATNHAISTKIMKLWLAKAKKRKVYWNAVSELTQVNDSSKCSICSKTSTQSSISGDRLGVYLCRNGKYDSSALDSLIDLFEEHEHQFSPTLSPNNKEISWKSFFWKNAEIKTFCNLCLTKVMTKGNEPPQQQRNRVPHPPAAPAVLEMITTSSDDDDEEEDSSRLLFEPLQIDQHSAPGRILSKWLFAARKGIDGKSPRSDHHDTGRRKAEQESSALLVNVHHQHTGESEELKKTSTKILSKWLNAARDNNRSHFVNRRGKILRIELNNFLSKQDKTDALLVLRRQDEFLLQGFQLRTAADLLTKDLEMATEREITLIKMIEAEKDAYIHELESERNRKINENNTKLKEIRSSHENRLAIRIRELKTASEHLESSSKEDSSTIERIKASMESEQVKTSKEIQRMEQDAQNKLQDTFDSIGREIQRKEKEAKIHIHQIRMQYVGRVQEEEHKWQQETLKWLHIAKRSQR
jgi:hypothetical protein